MSRVPLTEHKPWPGKIYKFFVVNSEGHDIEADLPNEDHAHVVIDYWKGQGVTDLHIEVKHVPQARGLGRDPDLH